jgi:hypothetical protein
LEIARTASIKTPSVSHPIFVLGLDAVDEAVQGHDRRALEELLKWFWEQEVHLSHLPRATLIVTCRDSKQLAEWLNIVSPYEDKPNPFRDTEVVVNEFSPDELVAAAREHLPRIAERFEQAYRALEVQPATFITALSSEMEAPSVLQPESPSLQPLDEEVFQALRHPALWHCLLKVDDGTLRSRVLDGKAEALEQLAIRFLSWFCRKMRARGKQAHDEDVIEVLKVIAHHCDPRQSPRHKNKDWVSHARKTPHMNKEQAESFFKEALSAGLIVPDISGWWRWHHPFVGEYLALQPLSEEDE